MQASSLIIFGATGDLTHRYIMPALYNLSANGLLPKGFNIVAFARRNYTSEMFRSEIHDSMKKFNNFYEKKDWKEFSQTIHYVQGNFDNEADYLKLASFLKKLDPPGSCTNKIFYLATAPSLFSTVLKYLESSRVNKLLGDCWERVIIEKPFGRDLKTAKSLNQLIADKFDENSIYRIDHYLAKETVQNILAFRFANGIFEPLWNKDYIDHIQITVSEELGVETRGEYYEESGNLRDIIQNHVLQLLALVTMEQPKNLESESIRDSRLEALQSLKKLKAADMKANVVFGQYSEGKIEGKKVPAYRDEPKVNPKSKTDTFTALKLFSSSPRWQGVPIYLRSGKRLSERSANICVAFKNPKKPFFEKEITLPNVLTFHIQPNEGISVRVMAKEPGHQLVMKPVSLNLRYQEAFEGKQPSAYEKLILDIIQGIQTLFPRADEVEAAWEIVDPIIKQRDKLKLAPYSAGSWGPDEADKLLQKDKRGWFTH